MGISFGVGIERTSDDSAEQFGGRLAIGMGLDAGTELKPLFLRQPDKDASTTQVTEALSNSRAGIKRC